jgi:magnesium transporter
MKKDLNASIVTRLITASRAETVGEILQKIKSNEFEYERQVFVTDAERHVLGYAELGSLLKTEPTSKIEKVTSPTYPVLNTVDLEYAASHAISKGMHTVPIIDQSGALVGLLPEKVIIETLRREHVEDIHKIAGIQKEIANASTAISEPPSRSLLHRLPWLLVGLGGSIFATFIMSRYEKVLGDNISLTFFIPGIVYLADAIGTQTETIVIRGLSLSWSTFKQILKKEFFTGSLIGLIFGILSLGVILLTGFSATVAITVASSILAAGMLATTIGLFLPYLLQTFDMDPAFGSGPLATVIQDILSVLVYLMIAQVLVSSIN